MANVDIELLDVKKLAYLLVNGYWQVSVVDEIDSTQTTLLAKSSIQHGEVLAAEYQSAGRGRLDRTFEAHKSRSLLFSFYIEPKMPRDQWGWIPLIAGLAITNVLNRKIKVFSTKWPNDVLALSSKRDGKISGVLSEVKENGVVVGVGINVAMRENELPVNTATSLALLSAEKIDRNQLLADFLVEFSHVLSRWESGEELRIEYIANSSTIGKKVEIQGTNGDNQVGVAVGIGSHGELVLEDGRHIYSGDVIHLYT